MEACPLPRPTHEPLTPPASSACSRAIGPSPRHPPVRLAKPTSNLFRARAKTDAAGPGHVGADGRHRGRPRGAHRRCGRHVHLRGPRRRDAALRARAARGAAAEDHHPRRRGHRASASSRRRSATGCRTSRCSRWTSSPAPARWSPPRPTSTPTCSAPSPTPTARWATRCACASSSSRCKPFVALTHLRFHALARPGRGDGPHHRRPAASTASRSTTSTASCSAPTRATCASGSADRGSRARSATTPASRSTTARSSTTTAHDTTGSPSTTTCGAGTPTGSGAPRRSGRSIRSSDGSGRGATCAAAPTGSS